MRSGRASAAERREQAVVVGLRAFADHGLAMSSMQQVAREMGVSQPYLFRLFGSKQAFFLACIEALETRVCEEFRQAAAAPTEQPLEVMGARFRELVSDGVATGLLLQACAVARSDEVVAARCRSLIASVLREAGQATSASPSELADFLARGSLVIILQAIGADLADGSQLAVEALYAEGVEA